MSNPIRTLAVVRATGLDQAEEQTPSSRRLTMAHWAIVFEWVRVPCCIKKGYPGWGTQFGAGNRTRTCTLAQWNLNPPSLPIPPCPQKSPCFYTAGKPRQSVSLNLRIYPSINGCVCQLNGYDFFKAGNVFTGKTREKGPYLLTFLSVCEKIAALNLETREAFL